MKKIVDYLIMRTPIKFKAFSGASPASPGSVSGRRIGLSLLGLFLGILCSFLVTRIERTVPDPSGSTVHQSAKVVLNFPPRNEALTLLLVSLVICMLSYQQLYASLRLFSNEPTFLVLFVSFQYGFFWQAVVKAVV